MPLVAKRLARGGPAPRATRSTVTGKTIGEEAAAAQETPGQQVVRPVDRAAQADRRPGHPARQPRAGGLRREGRRLRARAITAARRASSTARRRPSRRCRRGQIKAGDVVVIRYEGPSGRPRHARDARRHGRHRGRGARRLGGAAHRRPLLGRHARPDGRPRGAGSGARRPDCRRPRRRHHHVRSRQAASCDSRSSDAEIAARLATWTPPAPRYTTGVLAKYAKLVSSASIGAVTG